MALERSAVRKTREPGYPTGPELAADRRAFMGLLGIGVFAVGGPITLSGCQPGGTPPRPKPEQSDDSFWLMEPEIRVYADRGVPLPTGGKGGAVQVYGVRVKPDGSEIVIWKHFIWSWSGLLFDHGYTILLDESRQHAYLRFKEHRPEVSFQFHRETGRLVREISPKDPMHAELARQYPVERVMINRPDVAEMEAQRISAGPLP